MYRNIIRPILFSMDSEKAHNLSLQALNILSNFMCIKIPVKDPVTAMGLKFLNRVGLSAGLDKDGVCIDGFGALGVSHIELGTVTPVAQYGNSKPRLFRHKATKSILNRMGFNNRGIDNLTKNIAKSKFRSAGGILGINIGKNKHTELHKAHEDYIICMHKAHKYADYISLNISSPNTTGLRELQSSEILTSFLTKIFNYKSKENIKCPIVIKLSTDCSYKEFVDTLKSLIKFPVSGINIANTKYVNFYDYLGEEGLGLNGGLSGKEILNRNNIYLELTKSELGDSVALFGSGGVFNKGDAELKLKLGATLVQIYTGLIYEGPGLIRSILRK